MKVQFSDNAFMPGPRAATGGAQAPAKDFASELAKASTTPKETDPVKKTADTVKQTAGDVTKTADDVKKTADDVKPNADDGKKTVATRLKGERTEDVPGHAYDEIVAGPRNGMMLNDSGNVRDGKAFMLVERDGRSFHIYGSGKNRQVFEVGREPDQKRAPDKVTTSRTGATISPA